MIQKNTELKVP